MGKEWYWSKAVNRRENKESPAGCMSGMLQFLRFHPLLFTTGSTATTATNSSISRKGFPSSVPCNPHGQLKGLEAPRNSLELEEGMVPDITGIREEYYDVPLAIQVRPPNSASGAALTKKENMAFILEEERRNSQTGTSTPRTPNVVARLMGLEVLPNGALSPGMIPSGRSSPTFLSSPTLVALSQNHQYSQKKNKKKKKHEEEQRRESPAPRRPLQSRSCNTLESPAAKYDVGSQSLPDTPRVSSVRPWDVVGPRLSLQLNKENISGSMQEFSYLCEVTGDYSLPISPSSYLAKPRKDDWRQSDGNRSPRSRFYAREIVKQVKESVSNRRGSCPASCSEQTIKSRRTRFADKLTSPEDLPKNQSKSPLPKLTQPCSPSQTTMCLEPSRSKSQQKVDSIIPPLPRPRKPPRSQPSPSIPPSPCCNVEEEPKAASTKCKKPAFDRFTERIKKPLPAITAQLSDCSKKNRCSPIHSFSGIKVNEASPQPRPPHPQAHQDQISETGSSFQDPEFQYVRSILEQAGVMKSPAAHTFQWYSASHPLDPIVFHQLELELPLEHQHTGDEPKPFLHGPLRHRWNRKLLFRLVEEILGDLLERCHSDTPGSPIHLLGRLWGASGGGFFNSGCDGELLLGRLWKQIRSFPEADCMVISNIDALVEGDLPDGNVRRLLRHPAVAAEAADVTAEISREILDSLIGEAAAWLSTSCRTSRQGDARSPPERHGCSESRNHLR